MRRLLRLAVVLAVALAWTPAAASSGSPEPTFLTYEGPSHAVNGTEQEFAAVLTDAAGDPLPFRPIRLWISGVSSSIETTTDEDGRAMVNATIQGDYGLGQVYGRFSGETGRSL